MRTIQQIFQLPADIPRCIVKIQDFDDPATLQENIRDYVMSDLVAQEMARLVDRIVASCKRQEAGEGHYLHGSFGSGKSHFMAILGLILENHDAVWTKDHATIQAIRQRHGDWLAGHPILVVPVYMLGQQSFQSACYNAANARLQGLGHPSCEFSDADKVIAGFRDDGVRYGDVVWTQFTDTTGITRSRFDRMAAGEQAERDELAQQILNSRGATRVERAQLYPDKFSDGMAKLTRHVQGLGFAGVVFLVDELILYLTSKQGREYAAEINNLVALADNSALDRAVPLWTIVARQRFIDETVPDDASQQHIREAMEHHKDRFPETTTLADTELVPIVQERVLRVAPGSEEDLALALEETLDDLPPEARDTLLADAFSLDDFRRLYPFHPALIRTLIDISARLSRERAAIRLLYELLIKRHRDLPLGSLVPYASLFDVVFLPEGLTGNSRNDELQAVHQTYYERLAPLIAETYPDSAVKREWAHTLVKTVLLCSLSKSLRGPVSVERLLHLNYQDLRGRTTFGSFNTIAQILADLSNRSELVHFNPNPTHPGLGSVDITLASGVQLEDVLKRVAINWRQRTDAFMALMKNLLEQPIQNNRIPNFEWPWRGSNRRGAVRFENIGALSPSSDMRIDANDEFTLFIDYPYDLDHAYTRADDLRVIERARAAVGAQPIGFWLPTEFSADDLRELEEYAKMIELEENPNQYLEEYGKSQREEILLKLTSQRRTRQQSVRNRLEEVYFKSPDARVSFLDGTITVSFDVQSLKQALIRIADTVCDRRYPHHPRFTTPLNSRSLAQLLDDFLIPAALGNGSVPRTADRNALLSRLGEPLELAEGGATSWTLRTHSRYLAKLEELAAGRQVSADRVAQGLAAAFGFGRELCDTFILYLIKGQGYRALRNGRPVADVDFGKLNGLTLERGQRLAVHEWSAVKSFIENTWALRAGSSDLTVAAQDALWNQVNVRARTVGDELNGVREQLLRAFTSTGVNAEASARLAILDSARDLNALAQRSDLDAHDALKALLAWQPQGSGVTRQAAADQIVTLHLTRQALGELQHDTVNRTQTLADNGNPQAAEAMASLRRVLTVSNAQMDLTSSILGWQERANAIINAALQSRVVADPGPRQSDDVNNPPSPGREERVRERAQRIVRATLHLHGREISLEIAALERALGSAIDDLLGMVTENQAEGTLRIELNREG